MRSGLFAGLIASASPKGILFPTSRNALTRGKNRNAEGQSREVALNTLGCRRTVRRPRQPTPQRFHRFLQPDGVGRPRGNPGPPEAAQVNAAHREEGSAGRSSIVRNAITPKSRQGGWMVVNGGATSAVYFTSSKPATRKSCGARSFNFCTDRYNTEVRLAGQATGGAVFSGGDSGQELARNPKVLVYLWLRHFGKVGNSRRRGGTDSFLKICLN